MSDSNVSQWQDLEAVDREMMTSRSRYFSYFVRCGDAWDEVLESFSGAIIPIPGPLLFRWLCIFVCVCVFSNISSTTLYLT